MKSRLLNGPPQRTWVLVFALEDEPVEVLTRFAEEQHIVGARISGIGGFSEVTLGYFDPHTKKYEGIPVREQVEVMSLLGSIAVFENRAKLHAHVVIGKRDGTAHGGHLVEAKVRPTLEVFVAESPIELRRSTDPATGLPLLGL